MTLRALKNTNVFNIKQAYLLVLAFLRDFSWALLLFCSLHVCPSVSFSIVLSHQTISCNLIPIQAVGSFMQCSDNKEAGVF